MRVPKFFGWFSAFVTLKGEQILCFLFAADEMYGVDHDEKEKRAGSTAG